MTEFRRQLDAIGTALLLIQALPDRTVWALSCTNDDDTASPTTLNIFAAEADWPALVARLKLPPPIDRSTHDGPEQFVSYSRGRLLISLIDQGA